MIKTETIVSLLNANPDVSAYELIETANEGRQLYYVLGKLETSRAVDSQTIQVTVYHDFDSFRGSSAFAVTASDDETSIAKKIADCVEKAKQVKNPYYPLADNQQPVKEEKVLTEAVNTSLKKVANAIFAADHDENTMANATEIFGDVNHVHFLNSNQVEHFYDQHSMFVETVPSYKGSDDEYELYYATNKGNFSAQGLKEEMEEQLNNVRYRALAKKISEVDLPDNLPVYIQGGMLSNLMNNFAAQLSYQSQYFKNSHYQVGDEITAKPFDLTMKGEEEGALASSPVDGHGLRLSETKIIDQGKAAALWGDLRFGTYLKQETITGSYPVLVMDHYTPVSKEVFDQPHITVMNFSSPQLDDNSGYFGGEIRLALYHNGDQIIPLTGFSVSGNIYEAIKDADFSEEQAILNQRSSFKGPKYMILKNMKIH